MKTKVLSPRLFSALLGLCVACSAARSPTDQSAEPGESELDAGEQPDEDPNQTDATDDEPTDESGQGVSEAGSGRGGLDASRPNDTSDDATARSSDGGPAARNGSQLDGGGADAARRAPEAGTCVETVRTAARTVPDMMIVLDRSASMRTILDPRISCVGVDPITAALQGPFECMLVNCMDAAWMSSTACGGTAPTPGVDHWTPVVSAIKSLTSMFETRVSFGLVTFPAGTGAIMETQTNAQCAPGAIRVPLASNTAAAIAQALDSTQLAGYTPTSTTLQSLLDIIRTRKAATSAGLPPQFVLLVTDGAPNCVGQGGLDNDTQAHAATTQVLDALAQENVKTFVIGFDASVDARLAMQLAEYARHGGTDHFYPAQDASGLAREIVEITDTAVDCTYMLDQAPTDDTHLRVQLDQELLSALDADGFSLRDKTLTFKGAACAKLRDPGTHTLSVTFECAAPSP